MSPEAQRIAIAEACGIAPRTQCPECYGTGKAGSELDGWPCGFCRHTGEVRMYILSPDYPNDLNAMNEAEKVLDEDQSWTQVKMLLGWKPTSSGLQLIGWFEAVNLVRSTAAQRAEAFLKTLGLWEEDKT